MSDREPALLRELSREDQYSSAAKPGPEPEARHHEAGARSEAPGWPAAKQDSETPPGEPAIEPDPAADAALELVAPRTRRDPIVVFVVGFWRRLAAAAIDLAAVIPTALLITVIVGRITGLHMPSNLRLVDVDMWIDLILATDPALVTALVLFCAIGLTYLLVFQIIIGQTPGMRVLRIKIIDVYGDPPSAARCVVRCAGYVAGFATLFLGFLWMGFDSEKRGLQDWIAGTYVIRA
jgi:uncharacterized RDD family membrane protein YckC